MHTYRQDHEDVYQAPTTSKFMQPLAYDSAALHKEADVWFMDVATPWNKLLKRSSRRGAARVLEWRRGPVRQTRAVVDLT